VSEKPNKRVERRHRDAATLPEVKRRPWWSGALIVAIVAAAVYANGIPGEFVFDDKLIQRDARIRDFDVVAIFATEYWGGYAGTTGDLYRPLTIFSYALNRAVTGLSSPWFHVVNVLLHGLVCALVLFLVEALFADRRLAIGSALLFATHPVHTEAVTGIVGRAEILAALFLLVSLYLHATRAPLWRLPSRVVLGASLGAYFCALLSKETAIVGLGLLALVDWVRYVRLTPRDRARFLPPAAQLLALHLGIAVLYLGVRVAVLGKLLTQPPKRPGLLFLEPLGTRFLTVLEIFAVNLKLLFWPVTLSADYSYRQVPVVNEITAPVLVGLAAAVLLLGAFVWAVRRGNLPAAFALGFFAVSYAVVSNLIPIGVLVAERLLYLPSVGFCVAIAWFGAWAATRLAAVPRAASLRHVPAAALAVVLVLYSARTVARNLDWRDAETIYRATLKASPECQAAHFNYAAIVMERDDRASNELALRHLLRANEIHDRHFPTWVNLSNVYLRLGEPEKARDAARQGLERWPNSQKMKTMLQAAEAQLAAR
jgi:tetratricopeptide (TPR) repeat protein